MQNVQANVYLDEVDKQKDPVIGNLLERVMNEYVCLSITIHMYAHIYFMGSAIYM